jgi:hypothetical protein
VHGPSDREAGRACPKKLRLGRRRGGLRLARNSRLQNPVPCSGYSILTWDRHSLTINSLQMMSRSYCRHLIPGSHFSWDHGK